MTERRALVTGAVGAFGSALVERLEAGSWRVVGIDRDRDRDREGHGGMLQCDITNVMAVERAVAAAVAELGGLDALVNVAGIGTAAAVGAGLGEEERATLDVNLVGTWNVTAAALPELLRARGHVVNVASLLAVVNLPHLGSYAASKRALCAMSDVLRVEHRRDGLAVTTVYPGYVATPIHHSAEARSGRTLRGAVPEESVDQVVSTIVRALRRRPRDVAASRTGAIALRLGRHAPALLDSVVERRARRRGLLP